MIFASLFIHLRVQYTARKFGESVCCRIFNSKIFLVVAHYGHQHLFWKREVLRLRKEPNTTDGHSVKVRHGLDQCFIFTPSCFCETVRVTAASSALRMVCRRSRQRLP